MSKGALDALQSSIVHAMQCRTTYTTEKEHSHTWVTRGKAFEKHTGSLTSLHEQVGTLPRVAVGVWGACAHSLAIRTRVMPPPPRLPCGMHACRDGTGRCTCKRMGLQRSTMAYNPGMTREVAEERGPHDLEDLPNMERTCYCHRCAGCSVCPTSWLAHWAGAGGRRR